MSRSPFARFDRALGREHRAKTESDIEAGLVPAPKVKPRPTPKRRPDPANAVTLAVPPRVTAAAAITAHHRGSTTNGVITEWLAESSVTEAPPEQDKGLQLIIRMSIGPNGIPVETARELWAFAEERGEDPSAMAVRFIRERLAAHRAEQMEGRATA